MAFYHGKEAMVKFGSDLINLQNWSLTTSVDMAEITEMGDTWGNSVYGLIDFAATANGQNGIGCDTAALLGTSNPLVFEVDQTNQFTGTAFCTGINETQSYSEVGTISYTFVGNDVDGLAWS